MANTDEAYELRLVVNQKALEALLFGVELAIDVPGAGGLTVVLRFDEDIVRQATDALGRVALASMPAEGGTH